MPLSFIPSALLQNSLDCDKKYLDNKISSVEITGQMGPGREKERETDYCTVVCELSHYETPMYWPAPSAKTWFISK